MSKGHSCTRLSRSELNGYQPSAVGGVVSHNGLLVGLKLASHHEASLRCLTGHFSVNPLSFFRTDLQNASRISVTRSGVLVAGTVVANNLLPSKHVMVDQQKGEKVPQ
jgi:hypothetical protein